MDQPDRTVTDTDEEQRVLRARHEDDLDTGHSPWVRVVAFAVLAVFVLATLVTALL